MHPGARRTATVSVALLAVALVTVSLYFAARGTRAPTPAPPATARSPGSPSPGAQPKVAFDRTTLRERFVGSAACTPCHAEQAAAYVGSHHAKALVSATPDHVAAKLTGATFAS